MKLYKVTSNNDYEKTKYIIALDKAKAITKYYSLKNIYESSTVKAEYLCDRSEIIPTLDPVKEFKID